MVDDTMMNSNNVIDAVGYVDLHCNANESNDGYVQDNGSSNRIAWRSVNGVTDPVVLRELNIKNSGPQYVAAVPDPVVVFDESDPVTFNMIGVSMYHNGGT